MKTMKKGILQTIILIFSSCTIWAQITLDEEDTPAIGDTQTMIFSETNPQITIGIPGENQTWDFSSLEDLGSSTNNYISPTGTPGESSFSNATLALETDGDYAYFEVTSSSFINLGFTIDTSAGGTGEYLDLIFDPSNTFFQFPTTYNTSYMDESGGTITADGSELGFDSIRLVTSSNKDVIFDGWGTVITPNGSFDGLREKVFTTTSDLVEVKIFGIWQTLSDETSTDTTYNWYSKESKGPLIEVGILNDEIVTITYQDLTPTVSVPVAVFSYEQALEAGLVNFTDESLNQPSSWLWDFGDGDTSTEQNPSHTYTSNGMYEVCLTVTNSAGSNTSCQTVDIIISSVNVLISDLKIEIFPNPASDWLNLKLESDEVRPLEFVLFNEIGQPVINQQVQSSGNHNFDIKKLSSGLYYFIIKTNQGQIQANGSLLKN